MNLRQLIHGKTLLLLGMLLPAAGQCAFGAFAFPAIQSFAHPSANERKNDTLPRPADSLPPKSTELRQVVVHAPRPLVTQKGEMTIINPEALLSNAGTTALDVLANSPGLLVNENGGISMKGKESVAIFIDGKPAPVTAAELPAYLRSLPADLLERIELMPTPPARYQAAGTGGIINIVLRKTRSSGFSGSLTGNLGTGVYGSSNNNLQLGYRTDKWSLAGNAALNMLNNQFISSRTRDYFHPDHTPQSYLLQQYLEHSNQVSPSGWLDAEYFLSKHTTLSGHFSAVSIPYTEYGNYQSQFLDSVKIPDSSMHVNSQLRNNWSNRYARLGVEHSFKRPGNKLSGQVDYFGGRMWQDQILSTATFKPDGSLLNQYDLLPDQHSHSDTYSAQADYSSLPDPAAQSGLKLQTGWRSEYTHINFWSATGTRAAADSPVTSQWNNQFLFSQTVHAAYGSLSKEWSQWSVQLGLRAEATIVNGHAPAVLQQPDTSFHRSYTNLFPSLYIGFKVDSLLKNQFFLSASRRINRPGYSDLNPAVFYFDPHTLFIGNPLLMPEFSYTTTLSHVYHQNITTSVQYTHNTHLILQTFQQIGPDFITTNSNIGQENTFEADISGSLHPTPWWAVIAYTEFVCNYYYQENNQKTGIEGTPDSINHAGQFWRISATQQFRFGQGWTAELSAWYRSKNTQIQSFNRPVWYMNASLQKTSANGRWVSTLNARDIFHTKIYRREFNTLPGQTVTFRNETDTRIVSLTLTYKFHKQNGKTEPGSNDVKNAIRSLKNEN